MAFYVDRDYRLLADPSEFSRLTVGEKLDLITTATDVYEGFFGDPPSSGSPLLVLSIPKSTPSEAVEISPGYGTDLGWGSTEWDFRACERDDGSIYGTSGRCRIGREIDLPADREDVSAHNSRMMKFALEGQRLYEDEFRKGNPHHVMEVGLTYDAFSRAKKIERMVGSEEARIALAHKQIVDLLRHGMSNPVAFISKEAAKEMYDNKVGKKQGQVAQIEHAYPVVKIREEMMAKIDKMSEEDLIRENIPRAFRTQISLEENKRLSQSKLERDLPPGSSGPMARYNHVGIKIYPIKLSPKPSKRFGRSSPTPNQVSSFLTEASERGIPFEKAWSSLIMDEALD